MKRLYSKASKVTASRFTEIAPHDIATHRVACRFDFYVERRIVWPHFYYMYWSVCCLRTDSHSICLPVILFVIVFLSDSYFVRSVSQWSCTIPFVKHIIGKNIHCVCFQIFLGLVGTSVTSPSFKEVLKWKLKYSANCGW